MRLHPAAFGLWLALDVVLLRYRIGEAIAQDQAWRAAELLDDYAGYAIVAVLS